MLAISCNGGPIPDNGNCPGVGSASSATGASATAGSDEEFQEFVHERAEPRPDGSWVVDGDIRLDDDEDLRSYYGYEAQERTSSDPEFEESFGFRSAVACDSSGFDRTWPVDQKLKLTYCFGEFPDSDFGAKVRQEVRAATMEWERAADVNFIEIAATPAQCSASVALLQVVQGTVNLNDCPGLDPDECPNGSANLPPIAGQVLFWPVADKVSQNPLGLHRTVLHELGHVIGLIHEHERWEQDPGGGCQPKTSAWRGVTPRDPGSVMAYRSCNGTSSSRNLTFDDRKGAAYLYTLPSLGRTSIRGSGSPTDIVWITPRIQQYEVWYGVQGAQISFDRYVHCYGQDMNGTCVGTADPRVKPLAFRASNADAVDIFLFAPGTAPDWKLSFAGVGQPLSLVAVPFFDDQRYTVPILGKFSGTTASDDLWWHNPGVASDPLLSYDEMGTPSSSLAFDADSASDAFARPIVGHFVSSPETSDLPDSQVLWYREDSWVYQLSAQGNGPDTMVELSAEIREGLTFCLLSNTPERREMVPLVGNFDRDEGIEHDEIVWQDLALAPFSEYRHMIWRDVGALFDAENAVCIGGLATPQEVSFVVDSLSPLRKPIVLDMTGDGIDDILWYTPGPAQDRLWVFDEDGSFQNISTFMLGGSSNVQGDYSPIVGDFNGDGCEDILWFAPHRMTSPVWRAACDTSLAFISDTPVIHPSPAYPVAYARTRRK